MAFPWDIGAKAPYSHVKVHYSHAKGLPHLRYGAALLVRCEGIAPHVVVCMSYGAIRCAIDALQNLWIPAFAGMTAYFIPARGMSAECPPPCGDLSAAPIQPLGLCPARARCYAATLTP